jgi:hypothetical protein
MKGKLLGLLMILFIAITNMGTTPPRDCDININVGDVNIYIRSPFSGCDGNTHKGDTLGPRVVSLNENLIQVLDPVATDKTVNNTIPIPMDATSAQLVQDQLIKDPSLLALLQQSKASASKFSFVLSPIYVGSIGHVDLSSILNGALQGDVDLKNMLTNRLLIAESKLDRSVVSKHNFRDGFILLDNRGSRAGMSPGDLYYDDKLLQNFTIGWVTESNPQVTPNPISKVFANTDFYLAFLCKDNQEYLYGPYPLIGTMDISDPCPGIVAISTP